MCAHHHCGKGMDMEERLQKIIAAAGLCSRRTAEAYLKAGRITVNGRVVSLGEKADAEKDDIRLDGQPVSLPEETICILLHKPRGYACTLSDPHAEHLVTELIKECPVRLYPVGRLDVDSEGLLLLTNDGELTHRLLHPATHVKKVYEVTVSGLQSNSVERLCAMRTLEDGTPIQRVAVRLLREGKDSVLEFILQEGKKRQIRRMCRKAGLAVKRLCRVSEGGLTLGELPPGKWRQLTWEELSALKGED